MGRLIHKQKAKIVRLSERNMNISEIVKTLADDGCKISRLSVRRFLRHFQGRQSFENAPLPGRPAEDVTPQLMTFVDNQMEQNDELTAPNLQKKIFKEFGVNFSESKVKQLQKKLGAEWHEILSAYKGAEPGKMPGVLPEVGGRW